MQNRYHQWLSDIELNQKCVILGHLIQELMHVSLLESKAGTAIATHFADTGKRPLSHL
jgi:hypothetical protein